jgi:hypothetical protein
VCVLCNLNHTNDSVFFLRQCACDDDSVKLKHVRRLSGEVEEVCVTLDGKTNNFV